MSEFANEIETFPINLGPNASVEVYFGPPTAGSVTIMAPDIASDPAPISPATSGRVAPTRASAVPSSGSMRTPSVALQPTRGGGTGGVPPPNPIPQNSLQIQVFPSSGNTPFAQGVAPLTFVIPPPAPPQRVGVPAGVAGRVPIPDTAKWKLGITNLTSSHVFGHVEAIYYGNRPVLTAHIDIEALNHLFDRVLTMSQPITIALENRKVPLLPEFAPNHTIELTYVVFLPDPILERQFGHTEFQLPAKVVDQRIESFPIRPRLTINDGRLALKVGIEFPTIVPTLLTRNLIEGVAGKIGLPSDLAGSLADHLLNLNENQIRRLGADIILTMRDMSLNPVDAPGNTCDVLIQPHIELEGANPVATLCIEAGIQALGTQLYEWYSAAGGPTFDKFREKVESIWLALGRYLLGRDQPELIRQEEPSGIDLLYAGDAPLPPMHTDQPGPAPAGPLPELGKLANIDHIVVMMMENRSFDQMLGYLSLPEAINGGGRSDIDGLKGTEWNYTAYGDRVYVFPFEGEFAPLFGYDPGHGFDDQKIQRGGWSFSLPLPRPPGKNPDPGDKVPPEIQVGPMGGFVQDYARQKFTVADLADTSRGYGSKSTDIMGYHTKDQVWMYDFLAKNYLVCDRWYAAHPGDTWPNRFITLTGNLAPRPPNDPHAGFPEIGTPSPENFTPVHVKNIFDYLTEAGVSWRYYEHDLCMLRLFADYTLGHPSIVPIDDPVQRLETDVRNGNLPSVTFIEPDLSDVPAGNDDHPPSPISPGQRLVKRVYDALSSSKTLWPKTLLIVTYDECGGFYDHVFPPTVSDPNSPEYVAPMFNDPEFGAGAGQQFAVPVCYRGARVPAFVISPWVVPGKPSHTTYDHTSILKTIVTRFLRDNPPPLGERYNHANGLGDLLTLDAPRPAVASPDLSHFVIASPAPTASGHPVGDFRILMAAVRDRIQRGVVQ